MSEHYPDDVGPAILIVVYTIGGYEMQFKPGWNDGKEKVWERTTYDWDKNKVEHLKDIPDFHIPSLLADLQ